MSPASQQVTPHFHRAWQSPPPDGELRSGAQRRQSIVLIFRPAIFDGYVAALDEANFAQALTKCCELRLARLPKKLGRVA